MECCLLGVVRVVSFLCWLSSPTATRSFDREFFVRRYIFGFGCKFWVGELRTRLFTSTMTHCHINGTLGAVIKIRTIRATPSSFCLTSAFQQRYSILKEFSCYYTCYPRQFLLPINDWINKYRPSWEFIHRTVRRFASPLHYLCVHRICNRAGSHEKASTV